VGCEEYKLPDDLVDGTGEHAGQKCCPIHLSPVEMLAETNYFFALSRFTDRLIAHYEANPTAVAPTSARNEVMSFLRSGVKDLSISRSTFDWGVKVPWDPSHVVYVWFDALLNYATAVGLGDTEGPGKEQFDATFPADVHLVGKDILRFHAVIWPAMLMAAGLPLPRQVFAHGWLLVGGEKMSKSRLTGISPDSIVEHFGSDAFRYYFMRAISFGQDGSFSWEDMSARYTSELANGLGNLASRVTAMTNRYFDGVLPAAVAGPAEVKIHDIATSAAAGADLAIDTLDFSGSLTSAWTLVEALNGYLTEQEPWKVAKAMDDDPVARERVGTVLATAAEGLRVVAVLLNAVVPKACAALWQMLGAEAALGALADQRVQSAGQWGQLPAGVCLTKGDALFPRLVEDDDVEGQS
jgi:methionyl-tRNA synthetase